MVLQKPWEVYTKYILGIDALNCIFVYTLCFEGCLPFLALSTRYDSENYKNHSQLQISDCDM